MREVVTDPGKYASLPAFLGAWLYREWRRRQAADLITWRKPTDGELEPGCTALVGMCHHLPAVLLANLSCLGRNRWEELHEVIVVVDSVRGCLPTGLEDRAAAAAGDLDVRFFYYSDEQARRADRIKLPYLYSWLSWAIAMKQCRTRTALLHDYDALILNGRMRHRYDAFMASGARMQGIRWYEGNGIIPEDRLATTFEAFVDVSWVRQYPPIRMFNKIARHRGRSVDFDTLLEMQANCTETCERTLEPMATDSLIHPSQMIHQFTMARRYPGAALPVFSLPMVPFLAWVGGDSDALRDANRRITEANGKLVSFFEGVDVNFANLKVSEVAWALKQMLFACEALGIKPGPDLYAYGSNLYALTDCTEGAVWKGDFTRIQRMWITDMNASHDEVG